MKENQFTVIDLFAGAGGLSEGFHRAGFEVVACVEKDKYSCQTLRTRHIYWSLKHTGKEKIYQEYIKGDITKEQYYSQISDNPVINIEISNETLAETTNLINIRMKETGINSIDVFVGGPPCQAYSLVGRARDPYNMEQDTRNILYRYYVELLKKFRPKVFVFENVPGILSAGKGNLFLDVCTYFENAGYNIEYKLLDASDFMVLQKRKRVILIGWKKKIRSSYPEFNKLSHNYTVRKIFEDLPSITAEEGIKNGSYIKKPTRYLIETGIRKEKDILTHHVTQKHIKSELAIYKMTINLWSKEKKRLLYTDIPSENRTHRNQYSFLDRYKVVADDISYSQAITAHIAKDGRYYIHPDEKQLRSISIREAARLQSFPDDYYFEGSITSKFTQIGNAVPPLMAEVIAGKIKKMLK